MGGSLVGGPYFCCTLASSPGARENSDLDTTNIYSAFRTGLTLSFVNGHF